VRAGAGYGSSAPHPPAASETSGEAVTIDGEYVRSRGADFAENADLRRFIP